MSRDVILSTNNIGSEIVSETFLSTSLSQEHSRRFIDDSTKCCMYEILIPANSQGLFISPFSFYQNKNEKDQYGKDINSEYEILLPPSSRFIVKNKIGNITRLYYTGPTKKYDLSTNKMQNIMGFFNYPHATSTEDIINNFF